MNNLGFTLLEMLMVMFIITILLLLTIPNITKHKDKVEKTGCESFVDVAQTQVEAYELIEGKAPTSINQLFTKGYLTSETCSDGTTLRIDDGKVTTK